MIAIEDICEPEWADWYRMTPRERREESARLWHHYVAMGGLREFHASAASTT